MVIELTSRKISSKYIANLVNASTLLEPTILKQIPSSPMR